MISQNNAKRYCCEDISLIENYQQAVNDTTTTWHCHHRGEILPCGRYTPEDLKKFNLYYNRPANELIFLTPSDHMSLHYKYISEEARKKISDALKDTRKGKPLSEQARKKLSKAKKRLRWLTNRVKTTRAFQCPGPGWHRGQLRHRGRC